MKKLLLILLCFPLLFSSCSMQTEKEKELSEICNNINSLTPMMINDSFEFSSIECDFPMVNLKYRYTEYEMESYEVNEEMKLKTLPEVEAPINNNEGFKDFRDAGYTFFLEYLDKKNQQLFSFHLRKSSDGIYKIVELKEVNGTYELVEIDKNEWNKFYEIEFEKPEGWFDVTDKSTKGLFENVGYSEKQKEFILNIESKGLLVSRFSKYDPDNFLGNHNPTINILRSDNPFTNHKDFKNYILNQPELFKTIFNNYKLESELNDVKLDGLNGYTYIELFELPSLVNELIKIKSWCYVIPVGRYFYQIHFTARESSNSHQLFNSLSKSIKFKERMGSIESKYDITNNPAFQKMKKESIDRLMEKAKIEFKKE
jgi:hypothetical protein